MGTKDVVISEWLSDKVRFADLFNKCSKNSPTSSGGEMNCTSEHICSKNSYIIKETLVLRFLM